MGPSINRNRNRNSIIKSINQFFNSNKPLGYHALQSCSKKKKEQRTKTARITNQSATQTKSLDTRLNSVEKNHVQQRRKTNMHIPKLVVSPPPLISSGPILTSFFLFFFSLSPFPFQTDSNALNGNAGENGESAHSSHWEQGSCITWGGVLGGSRRGSAARARLAVRGSLADGDGVGTGF